VTPEDKFYDAFMKFMKTNAEELLVESPDDGNLVLGVLRHDDLIAPTRRKLQPAEEHRMKSFWKSRSKSAIKSPEN
jgi:hypothetical protein